MTDWNFNDLCEKGWGYDGLCGVGHRFSSKRDRYVYMPGDLTKEEAHCCFFFGFINVEKTSKFIK